MAPAMETGDCRSNVLELASEQGYGFATMLAIVGAAVLLVALFYYRAFGMLRPRQWQTLLLLRIGAILVVLLFLFRLGFSFYQQRVGKPPLIFLLDASGSMSIADDASGVSRFNQARSQLEKWCHELKDDFTIYLVAFAERAYTLGDPGQLASLTPTGRATSLSAALQAAAQQVPKQERPVAILVSDGIHNSARPPAEVTRTLRDAGIVVHTVGVGASLRSDRSFRDVQVTGITCPDRLLINNKARIAGLVEGIGMAGQVVKVVLEDEGKPIQETQLTLDEIEGAQKVEFEFTPTVKGRHTYTIRVPPVPQEKITENNYRSAVSMVIEPGIRVLYIEGTLRGEYGAIVDRFLSKDPDLEFCALIQTRPNFFLTRTNIKGLDLKTIPSDAETLNRFDVFILGDLDSTYLKPEQQNLIVQKVRSGGGLVMLGGYHALGPGGYAGTPIGEVLPVFLGDRKIGQVDEPFLPLLTPDGVRHPIFANIADFFRTQTGLPRQSGLPELDGCTRVQRARPGASVLAIHPTDVGQMPVLAVQPLDKGRTAVFCGDTTRKWQQGPLVLGQDSPFLRFWGQMVRWLAGRSGAVEEKASITAAIDKGFYEPEEQIQVTAIVRDEKGQGSQNAQVKAKIKGPTASEEVALTPVPGPTGHYAGAYKPRIPGRYDVVVEARAAQVTLSSEKLVAEVGRVNLEFEKLDMDDKMLAQIAAETRGRYVHLSTASTLIGQLDRSRREQSELRKTDLYRPAGLFWAVFVALVSTEWYLRRRFLLR